MRGIHGELVIHLGDHIEDLVCCFGDCEHQWTGIWPNPACWPIIPCPKRTGKLESIHYYVGLVKTFVEYTGGSYYLVLGNHDIRTFTMNELVLREGEAKKHWEAAVKNAKDSTHSITYFPPYAAESRNGWAFVYMNSGEDCKSKSQSDGTCFNQKTQLDPLKQQLQTHSSMPTVMFWHVNPKNDIDDCKAKPSGCYDRHPYLKVLADHKKTIKAVFTGHTHAFDYYTWNGIEFYVCGSTGKPQPLDHDLWMDVTLASDGSVTIDNHATIHWIDKPPLNMSE
jgi:hypothetical protein